MKGHHHPGCQIWEEDSRTVCFLWRDDSQPCDWNGKEMATNHPGATMIWCNDTTLPTVVPITGKKSRIKIIYSKPIERWINLVKSSRLQQK